MMLNSFLDIFSPSKVKSTPLSNDKEFKILEKKRENLSYVFTGLVATASVTLAISFFSFGVSPDQQESGVHRSLNVGFQVPANDDVPRRVLNHLHKTGVSWKDVTFVLNLEKLKPVTKAYLSAQWLILNEATSDSGQPLPREAQLALLRAQYEVLSPHLYEVPKAGPWFNSGIIYLVERKLFGKAQSAVAKPYENAMSSIGVSESTSTTLKWIALIISVLSGVSFAIYYVFARRVARIAALSLKASKRQSAKNQADLQTRNTQAPGKLSVQLFEQSIEAYKQRTKESLDLDLRKDSQGQYINSTTARSLHAFREASDKQLKDDSFMRSMLFGYSTDSAMLGYAMGGNLAGALNGALLSEALKSDSRHSEPSRNCQASETRFNDPDYIVKPSDFSSIERQASPSFTETSSSDIGGSYSSSSSDSSSSGSSSSSSDF
jgi:hypothetical protein